jgi:hypothetical protein
MMQEGPSTTITFMRIGGPERDRGYTPIYSPVLRQSQRPAPRRPGACAFDAHQASSISPQTAHTLALLTTREQQDTHSFESLLKALTLGAAASARLPETQLSARRPSRVRGRRLPLLRAARPEQQPAATLNWT